jgi:hypothetical protein
MGTMMIPAVGETVIWAKPSFSFFEVFSFIFQFLRVASRVDN